MNICGEKEDKEMLCEQNSHSVLFEGLMQCGGYRIDVSAASKDVLRGIEQLVVLSRVYKIPYFLDSLDSLPVAFNAISPAAFEYVRQWSDEKLENILSLLKGCTPESKRQLLGNAYAISCAEDAVEVAQYDRTLVSMLESGLIDTVTIQRDKILVWKQGIPAEVSLDESIQTIFGERVLVDGKAYERRLRRKEKMAYQESMVEGLTACDSMEDLSKLIHEVAPSVREDAPDAAYNICDVGSFIPREIYEENWIFTALKNVVKDSEVEAILVGGSYSKHSHWYDELADQTGIQVYRVGFTSESVREKIRDGEISTMYLRCPFSTVQGKKFYAGFSMKTRNIVEYDRIRSEGFLKGLYDAESQGCVYQAALFENYPIPLRLKRDDNGEAKIIMLHDAEVHSFYGCCPHRDRGIFVSGLEGKGDLNNDSGGRSISDFYAVRLFATLRRNDKLFSVTRDSKTYTHIIRSIGGREGVVANKMSLFSFREFVVPETLSEKGADFDVSQGLAQLMYMAAHGQCDFVMTIEDMPEMLFNIRERILELGILTGVIKLNHYQGMETSFTIKVPFSFVPKKKDRPLNGFLLEKHGTVKISDTGRVIGDIRKPVSRVVFLDGDNIYDDAKSRAGLARIYNNRTMMTIEKVGAGPSGKVGPRLLEDLILELCRKRAYTPANLLIAVRGVTKVRDKTYKTVMTRLYDLRKLSTFSLDGVEFVVGVT